MIPEFDRLSASETEMMLKAPILVCILIAGADNDIDKKEIQQAIGLAQQKQRKAKAKLVSYYQIVGEDFEDKLKVLIQSFPIESTQRTPILIEELSTLNQILPKIDKSFAREFYNSLLDIALKIAESSGGLLGMKSIGFEEARYVKLPMIKDPSLG